MLNLSDRTVVGFDLRRDSTSSRVFMTSYDDTVRYEEINEKYQDQLSGMNLFYVIPSDIPSLIIPVDAKVVAFDLPTELVSRLSSGVVSNPQPLPIIDSKENWVFLGFDIVDPITQTSALYGFNLSHLELNQLKKKFMIDFNKHGLIDKWEDALNLTKFFDAEYVEHRPFSPSGVWLLVRNGSPTF